MLVGSLARFHGKLTEAKALYERALAIYERRLGKENLFWTHQNVTKIENAIAHVIARCTKW
jgi:hypothetical protein